MPKNFPSESMIVFTSQSMDIFASYNRIFLRAFQRDTYAHRFLGLIISTHGQLDNPCEMNHMQEAFAHLLTPYRPKCFNKLHEDGIFLQILSMACRRDKPQISVFCMYIFSVFGFILSLRLSRFSIPLLLFLSSRFSVVTSSFLSCLMSLCSSASPALLIGNEL